MYYAVVGPVVIPLPRVVTLLVGDVAGTPITPVIYIWLDDLWLLDGIYIQVICCYVYIDVVPHGRYTDGLDYALVGSPLHVVPYAARLRTTCGYGYVGRYRLLVARYPVYPLLPR